MAVTGKPAADQIGWIDPREEAPVVPIAVRPELQTPIDDRKIELIYDQPSDTFSFLLYGRERLSVVVDDGDTFALLVDPESGEIVGLQAENFLSKVAVEHPQLLEGLEIAELLGMTRKQAREERHRILGYRGRFCAWLRYLSWGIRMRTRSRRKAIVGNLIPPKAHGVPARLIAPST